MKRDVVVGKGGRIALVDPIVPVASLTDRDAVLAEAEDLTLEIARIKSQLEEAKQKAMQEGVYADGDWYRRASSAVRFKGVRHQQLLRRAAQLRTQANAAGADDWRERFVQEARRRLKPETFAALLEAARETP